MEASSQQNVVSRRNALKFMAKTSLVTLLASACRLDESPITPNDPNRPNILYLHSHDTGRYVEPYGYDIPTPNLKRFAEEGMLFRQAFSAAPTCSPSRAALLTGMTPGCNGMWGLAHTDGRGGPGYRLNDYSQTIIHALKTLGYTSALAGTQHIVSDQRYDPQINAAIIGYDLLLKSRTEQAIGHVAPCFDCVRAKDVTDAAIEFLDNRPPQPFFLDVGFVETHLLPDGESRFGYQSGDTSSAALPRSLDDTAETRRDMADYEVAAGVLDEAVGRVLEAVERNGLKDNTLVILTTDHGIPLPGMKGYHTDDGLGVMLMIRGPFGFSGGKVSNALVSQIDIFPTLCDVLGLEPPPWLQGTSLMPLVRGEAEQVNETIFAEHEAHAVPEPQASVRTERYKYIRRLDGSDRVRPPNVDNTHTKELWLREGWDKKPVSVEQLYDLSLDPQERNNLLASPSHIAILDDMRRRMVVRMEEYDNSLLRSYKVSAGPPEHLNPVSKRSFDDTVANQLHKTRFKIPNL